MAAGGGGARGAVAPAAVRVAVAGHVKATFAVGLAARKEHGMQSSAAGLGPAWREAFGSPGGAGLSRGPEFVCAAAGMLAAVAAAPPTLLPAMASSVDMLLNFAMWLPTAYRDASLEQPFSTARRKPLDGRALEELQTQMDSSGTWTRRCAAT